MRGALCGIIAVLLSVSVTASDDAMIIADDDRPSSLGVLAGLPRPSFSLGGVSSDLATYARDTDKFQKYMDELSEELDTSGALGILSFSTSGNPDDPRGYVQALVVWACIGVAWFLLVGILAFCMCSGRCCCCGPACCGRKYPTVKGGAYSARQKAFAYGLMALFVVCAATFVGLAQGRGNAGLTEAQKRLVRGAGYGAAASARATVPQTVGPLLEAYSRAVVVFATDVNDTATEALPPADIQKAATCVGTVGGAARHASDELRNFVAASDAVAANPFCAATLDAFQEAAHRALSLQINVSCGFFLKGLLVSANATLAAVPQAFWDAVGQLEKGADVNEAEADAGVDVNATVANAKKMKDAAEGATGVDCCTTDDPTEQQYCADYWNRDDSGAKATLQSARDAADKAQRAAAEIASQIDEPARTIADFAGKYSNFTTRELGAALAPLRAPALAATVAGPGGVAAGIEAVARGLRAMFDPWGIDTSALRDVDGSDAAVARASTGGDATPTVTRVRRVVAAVEDRGGGGGGEAGGEAGEAGEAGGGGEGGGALEAHGPWYYLTRVLLAAELLNGPDDRVVYPAAAALSAATAADRTMLLFGTYDKAAGDAVDVYPASLRPDGAAPAATVACVTDGCINATIDYLNARVLPVDVSGGGGGDDGGDSMNGNGFGMGGGGMGGGGMDGGIDGGMGGGDSGGSAFAGIEGVLLNPDRRVDGVDRELLMLLPALLVVLLILAGFFAAAIPALTTEPWSPCRGADDDAARRGRKPNKAGCGSRLACCVGVGSLLLAPWAFLLAGAAPFPLLLAAGDACGSARPLLRERAVALAAEASFCGGGGGGGGGGGSAAAGTTTTCRIGGADLLLEPDQVWDVDVDGVVAGIVGGDCAAGSAGGDAVAGLWLAMGQVARATVRQPIDTALDRLDGTGGAGDPGAGEVAVRGKVAQIARSFGVALGDATRDGVAAHGAPGGPGSCEALHAAFRAAWAPVCGAGGLVDAWYWAAAGTYLVAFALLCCGAPAGVLGHKRFAPAAATRAWQRRGLRAAGGGGGGAQDDDEDYESPVYRDNPLRNDGGARDIENGNGNGASAAGVPTAHPVQRRSLSFRERWFGGPSPTSSLRTMDADGGTAAGAVASAPPVQEIELADRERALAASRADAGLPVAVSVVGEAPAAQRGSRATMLPGDYALAAGMPAANNNDDENNLDDLTTAQEDAVPAFYHPNSGSPTAASAPPADDEVVSVS